jgi:phage terminase large subunit-like protein
MNRDVDERNARAFEYLYNTARRRNARRLFWVTVVLMTPLVLSTLVILASIFLGWNLPL